MPLDQWPSQTEVSVDFNMVEMSNGTEYRVLVDYPELVERIDSALKAGGLLTLPMGMTKPGISKTINPQHVVSLTDLSEA
jgi:hypothetical protein